MITDAAFTTLVYIGPGADLGMIGSMIGLFVTLGTSALFMVLLPIRTFFRKFRNPTEAPTEDPAPNP